MKPQVLVGRYGSRFPTELVKRLSHAGTVTSRDLDPTKEIPAYLEGDAASVGVFLNRSSSLNPCMDQEQKIDWEGQSGYVSEGR